MALVIVNFFLVSSLVIFFRVHALHQVSFKAERLVSSDKKADEGPHNAHVAADVSQNGVECRHSPLLFHKLTALQQLHPVDGPAMSGLLFVELTLLDPFVEQVLVTGEEWEFRQVEKFSALKGDVMFLDLVNVCDARASGNIEHFLNGDERI